MTCVTQSGASTEFRTPSGDKIDSHRDTVFYAENCFRFMSIPQAIADEILEARTGAYRVVFVVPIETLRLREEATLGADVAAVFGVWTDPLPSTRLHVVLAQEGIKRVWVSGP